MAKPASENRRAQRLLFEALQAPEKLPALPPADWELLLRVARRNRLLGRLQSDLEQANLLGQIPPRAAAHLRASHNVIAHRQTLISWEVNRLLWALKGIDVPLILLKGTGYLLAGLPPARGRIFADLDLLVPEDRLGEIEERLVERGWFKTDIDPYDDRYYRVWMHEIPPLRHRERGTEIDIHHRLLPKTSHLKSDPAPLFAAARPLADPRLRVLAPADMVLHALVHLFLEGDPDEGLRLRDLVDVHDLLCHHGQEPGFWAGLALRARELGFQRPLFYGLHHAQRLFGTPIPPEVLRGLADAAPAWPIRGLMDRLIHLALLPEHPDYPSRLAALARWLIYVRAHWLRMPPGLLARHLSRKAWLRFRGFRKRIDLAQLDLKQQ
ncbi:nucleotidyltransferase family protein [Candidatus Accumulibacter sp. ACC003]|uniref:nucleotidyltransferase domain-containing protein n=1 Tax=Candidatus Accumulibacter sp. ACC003 TaxID=2823334 RepID=UPI0025BB5834|nr:nucleotidyltransferase family protein [Candidatus Accumulibacter sp. ACC003]